MTPTPTWGTALTASWGSVKVPGPVTPFAPAVALAAAKGSRLPVTVTPTTASWSAGVRVYVAAVAPRIAKVSASAPVPVVRSHW